MRKIREVIVVEGRYDKNTLAQTVDATVITLGGFSVFNDKEKLAFLRKLAELHRTEPAIRNGSTRWITNDSPDQLCTYLRETETETVFCAINLGNSSGSVDYPYQGEFLLERGASVKQEKLQLEANGFAVIRIRK